MKSSPVKVAIIGASGYSGEELVRLLLHHPHAELTAVTSRQHAGKTLAQIFPRYGNHPRAKVLRFSDPNSGLLAREAEIIFLALPHGVAAEYAVPLLEQGCRVIDLSADFRITSADVYKEFYGHDHSSPELLGQAVYGLPELYRDKIKGASFIASPGCYPTSILLPIVPLLREKIIKSSGIIADSLSGVSGAGRKAEIDYLFVECNESMRPYGIPKHRHLSEIEQELSIAAGESVTIQFSPHLIPVNRGILSTIYLAPEKHFSNADRDGRALGKNFKMLSGCLRKRTIRSCTGRQSATGHQECRWDEYRGDCMEAGSAHGSFDRDERIGQRGQRREWPGNAKHEPFLRFS